MAVSACCLFDGYGGFELGARLAGIDWRTVVRVERDSHAAATLVARMEETHLDQAPIWDDVTTFDGQPWHRRVDIVTAGFNCQPFSSAGQRLGVDDVRWLWPDIARIVADLEPRYVWLENVTDVVRLGGLDRICGDLAALGFDAEWGCYSAAEVGAPHKRNRWWLLGDASSGEPSTIKRSGHGRSDFDGAGDWQGPREPSNVADPAGLDEREPHHETRTQPRRQPRPDTRGRSQWPPRPDDRDGWEQWIAEGGPEPQIRRVTDGPPTGLAESLHLGGNGLVPAVAAAALEALVERFGASTMTTTTRTVA